MCTWMNPGTIDVLLQRNFESEDQMEKSYILILSSTRIQYVEYKTSPNVAIYQD